MSKRAGSSKPSLKQPGTPKPAAPKPGKSASGPPMLGFSHAETAFFLAGQALSQAPATKNSPVRYVHPRPVRRAALRVIVSALIAGAGVLAWVGPGKVAAPVVLSHVQLASLAHTNALVRARTIVAPPREISQVGVPAKAAAVPVARPKPHPATANRARSRHR